jgi:hypothetical protein
MIADFGLSRVMDSNKLSLLTEICGTPGVSFHLSSTRYPSSSLFAFGHHRHYLAQGAEVSD